MIAERVLGRGLRKGEIVHHVDGDRQNNVLGNLLICTVGYHRQLHERMASLYQVEHFRSRGDFDVSALCKQYGGGGHKAAAGFTSEIGWLP